MLIIMCHLLDLTEWQRSAITCVSKSAQSQEGRKKASQWGLCVMLFNICVSMFKKRPLAGENASRGNCMAAFLQHHRPWPSVRCLLGNSGIATSLNRAVNCQPLFWMYPPLYPLVRNYLLGSNRNNDSLTWKEKSTLLYEGMPETDGEEKSRIESAMFY